MLMRIAFGGQLDAYDFHYVGLTHEILGNYLSRAGFTRIEKAGDFGLFEDTSSLRFGSTPVSLNVIAYKS